MKSFIADKFKERNYSMGNKKGSETCSLPLINLGIGDLDIHTDEHLIELAMADAKNGHTHYTDSYGYLELREEICKYHKENFKNYNFNPKDVMITTGACHALYLVFKSILNKGEEAILLAPFFPVYADQIKLSDGVPVIVETKLENNFQIVKEDLEKAVTSKTKCIVMNSPSNPTGVCYNMESMNIIKEIAEKYDLLVVADDVYDFYSYEETFTPIITLDGMKERTISVCSFSKNFAMTGWRIGYVISQVPELINCINYINEAIIYSAPAVSQRCALHALKDFDKQKKKLVPIFKERVDYSYDRVKKIPFLDCFKAQGGIYLFLNIEKTGMTSEEFTDFLLEKCNIIVVNGTPFGVKGFVRIACTLEISKLGEAFDRMENMISL